jgi:protein tyrosine/serine phosphatase
MYQQSLEDVAFGRSLTSALELLSHQENRPALFHCSLGKDRAGVLAASLLAVLGVTDDDIAIDYALSAESAPRRTERRGKNEPVDSKPLWPDWVYEAPPESMLHVLAFVRREFGSMDGYLQSHGGDATLPDRLRAALLD